MTESTTLASPAAARERHVQDKRAAVPEQLDRIGWSAERLAAERRKGLRALLRFAKERSAWHQARLREVDPDSFEEHDLGELPIMTKHDVMTQFDGIATDPRVTLAGVEAHLASLTDEPRPLLGRYHAIASGGSTGVHGVFLYDWDAWVTCYLGWFRYLLRDMGCEPFSMALVAAGKPSHISRALLQTFSDRGAIARSSFPITRPLDEIAAGLNDVQPDTILAYPSALVELVRAARDGRRLRIAPQAIVTGGEPLLPEIRASAEATFGVPILNWWLSSEAGPMGIGCGHGPGLHLSDDLLIIEPVDQDDRAVPPGIRASKVLLTNLYNPALPLIRYELTDEVTLIDEPCPCGSQHRLIADPLGRLDDGFRYGETLVHPLVFRSVLGSEAGIIEYQVRQTERGAAIAIRGDADTARLTRELQHGLRRLGVEHPEVTLTKVPQLDRQHTGKIRRFLPL